MDEGSSTDVEVQEQDGGLMLDGVGLYFYTPNDSLSIHILKPKREKKRFSTTDQIHEWHVALIFVLHISHLLGLQWAGGALRDGRMEPSSS